MRFCPASEKCLQFHTHWGIFEQMQNNSREKKGAGFALIEVLIIFVIVVLLAVMTVPVFKKMNELSKDDSSPSVTPVPIEEQGMPK